MLVTAVLVLLVRSFVATPFAIPSASMAPMLQVGDRILVDRLTYRFRDVRRGEVVVFDGMDTFGRPPTGRGRHYVKRVIGVGGDRVACCDDDGRLMVNRQALDERAYLGPGQAASELRFDVEVPAGGLWLMGDHRSDSMDSRSHLGDPGGGAVPAGDVVGRVVAVMWPVSRLGGLP